MPRTHIPVKSYSPYESGIEILAASFRFLTTFQRKTKTLSFALRDLGGGGIEIHNLLFWCHHRVPPIIPLSPLWKYYNIIFFDSIKVKINLHLTNIILNIKWWSDSDKKATLV